MKITILALIAILLTATTTFAGSDTVLVSMYDNGAVKTETSMKDGVRDGLSKFYAEDGKLVYAFGYRNGVPHDTTKFYYDGGRVYDVTLYNDGTFVERNIYNEDGSLAYRSTIEMGKCVERNSNDKVIYSKDSLIDKYCK